MQHAITLTNAMIQYYLKVLKQYADFNGRARRSEYWYYTLVNMIVIYGLIFLGGAMASSSSAIAGILATLSTIYALATMIPSIAAGVRRMHDVGKSGWFILIPLYNLILAVTEGQTGSNEYGPDPKAAERKGITADNF